MTPDEELRFYLSPLEITGRASGRASARGVLRSDLASLGGHFPGNPLLAGAFQLELVAVLAGLVLPEGWRPIRVEHARFRRMVRPGDEVTLEVAVKAQDGDRATIKASLEAGETRACQATLIFTGP